MNQTAGNSTEQNINVTFYVALFLVLFSVYLLTYTPRINASDGIAMFSTAESLIRRGALDVEQIRWMGLQQGTYGLDGLLYSRKGIGVPMGLLPLVWLGFVVPGFGLVSASLLFNAIVTALTAVILAAYVRALGFGAQVGGFLALTFGLSTLAWPYAKSLFSDPFSGLLLLAAAYSLHQVRSPSNLPPAGGGNVDSNLAHWERDREGVIYSALAGLLLGWNVATRYAEVLFVPVFGVLLLVYIWDRRRTWTFWRHGLAFVIPLAVIAVSLIGFNVSRYGSPFDTGYLPNETFSGIWWQGILGQLVSPGRGLLLYCPVLGLSFAGMIWFVRRHPAEGVLALSIIVIHLLLYGKWFMWHGGYAWGPRFMIPTLPFWTLLLAPILTGPRWLRVGFVGLALLGLLPQGLSVVIDFAPFQNSLLDTGLPLFAPVTFFAPVYSPFLSAWPFIRWDAIDLVWLWAGRFNGWLLAALLLNVMLAVVACARVRLGWLLLASLSTLLTTGYLLTYAQTLHTDSLRQTVEALNAEVQPQDAIILNHPDITLPFADLYQGRAPVLGLNSGGFPLPGDVERRLGEVIDGHARVWWVPNWISPNESAIEQMLQAEGFRIRAEDFNGQRLVLWHYPPALETHAVNARFDGIELISVGWATSAGGAVPVELRWQAVRPIAEDYHVFVHLLNAEGERIAQSDGQPALWQRPTSTWQPVELITDRHGLWLPTPEPGPHTLLIGLYAPHTGERLTLPDGSDSVSMEYEVGSRK